MIDSWDLELTQPPFWQRFWWVLASFFLPFVYGFFLRTPQGGPLLLSAARCGLVGLGVAFIISLLWRIDCCLGPPAVRSTTARVLLYLLGAVLWLIWLVAAHMFLLVYDEVNSPVSQVLRPF
jgi:hypothetical protein